MKALGVNLAGVFVLGALSVLSSGCNVIVPTSSAQVPSHWHQLPEDQPPLQRSLLGVLSAEKGKSMGDASEDSDTEQSALAHVLQRVCLANTASFDEIPEHLTKGRQLMTVPPSNWVPWHLEALTTDLAVTVGGLLGVLTVKGTSAASIYWRRQGPQPHPLTYLDQSKNPESSFRPSGDPTYVFQADEQHPPEDLDAQIEPAIQAGLSTGKIQDESSFRTHLKEVVQEFKVWTKSLEGSPNTQWWLGGLKFEFSFDAMGRVQPYLMVGGDLRFRFAWKRLKRNSLPAMAGGMNALKSVALLPTSDSAPDRLRVFLLNMEALFEEWAGEPEFNKDGFKPYLVGIELGMTANGNIGIVKGSTSFIGSAFFFRDTRQPVIFSPEKARKSALPFLLIEDHPPPAHLHFVQSSGLFVGQSLGVGSGGIEGVIDPSQFKAGLNRALKIGRFFGRSAQSSTGRHWKAYEIRASFQASLTGSLGLVGVGGTASLDMGLYNENF